MSVFDQASHIDLYAVGRFLSLSFWAACVMKRNHTGVKSSSSVCPCVNFSLLVSFSSRAVSHIPILLGTIGPCLLLTGLSSVWL